MLPCSSRIGKFVEREHRLIDSNHGGRMRSIQPRSRFRLNLVPTLWTSTPPALRACHAITFEKMPFRVAKEYPPVAAQKIGGLHVSLVPWVVPEDHALRPQTIDHAGETRHVHTKGDMLPQYFGCREIEK